MSTPEFQRTSLQNISKINIQVTQENDSIFSGATSESGDGLPYRISWQYLMLSAALDSIKRL